MNSSMRKSIFTLILLSCLCSCSKDGHDSKVTDSDMISFAPEIMPMTKAGNEVGSLTSFGLIITPEASEKSFYGEMVLDDGQWIPDTGSILLWGMAEKDTDFFAFVPYSENVSSENPFQVSVSQDQTLAENVAESDFMTARTTASKSDGSVRLAFSHRFSKINVSVTVDGVPAESDLLTDVSLRGLKTMASFDPADCSVIPEGEPYEIYMYKDTDFYTCMAIPQSVEQGALSLTVTYDEDTFIWTSDEGFTLEPGTEYTLKINAVTTK